MRIETERLIVRPFEQKDEKDLGEYMLQRVNERFESYPDFTPEKLPAEIKFRCSNDEFFAIELKETGKVIGNIYFGKREFETRELAYVLNKNFLRQGYGAEAASAFVKYALSHGTRRIIAETNPDNTASWKLMEKIGMQREAHFHKNVSFKKDADGNPIYWDTYVYALLNRQEQE